MNEYDWTVVRARWEAGESANQISKDPEMPSRQAIDLHVKNEQWQRRIEPGQVIAIASPEEWDELNDKQKVAINAAALGARTFKEAAIRANAGESTLRTWRKDERFRRLFDAARLAKRDYYVSRIEGHGERDWRADAWLLKSMYSEEFGDKNQAVTVGNQYNILGGVSLGIDRSEPNVIDVTPEKED